MVSVRFGFHQYHGEVRQAILRCKAALDSDWDPFVAAWLAYALSHDGIENNPPLSELVETLHRWSRELGAWDSERHLGPLSLLAYLRQKQGRTIGEVVEEISRQVEAVDGESRFCPLRDPEQVFLIALGLATAKGSEGKARENLVRTAGEQMKGPLKRRILYAAALRELGESVDLRNVEVVDMGDSIALVWWSERYAGSSDRGRWWSTFANIKDNL